MKSCRALSYSNGCCWRMCYKQHYKNVTTAEAPDLSLPITPCSALVRAVVIRVWLNSAEQSTAPLSLTIPLIYSLFIAKTGKSLTLDHGCRR